MWACGTCTLSGRVHKTRPPSTQSGHRVIGHQLGDALRWLSAFGTEPGRRPVERAEKGARRHGRIAAAQLAAANAGGDERADTALVAIALGDDGRAQASGEGVDLEVRRRPFDAVDQTQDVRDRQRVQPRADRPAAGAGGAERAEKAVERPILTKEQDLVLAAEVVVQVAGGEVGGDGDLAHAGGGEAAGAEDAGGGAEDLETPGVGAAAGACRAAHGTG